MKRPDCADQFVVKYWMRKSPNEYMMSEFVGSDQVQVEVDVMPRVEYDFQVIVTYGGAEN